MRLNAERLHFLIRDTLSCFIAAAFEINPYTNPGCGAN
jgi:hypothetical protein